MNSHRDRKGNKSITLTKTEREKIEFVKSLMADIASAATHDADLKESAEFVERNAGIVLEKLCKPAGDGQATLQLEGAAA